MEKYLDFFKEFVEKFLRGLYVDDSISGAQCLKECLEFYCFLKNAMLEGGFLLRKWNSNSQELMDTINNHERCDVTSTERKKICKVLGVTWDTVTDELIFDE